MTRTVSATTEELHSKNFGTESLRHLTHYHPKLHCHPAAPQTTSHNLTQSQRRFKSPNNQ
eukprot:112945-Hanusia_phi.AAC.1